MAPRIQPWPLYRICLASASNLVDQACTNIFLEHGSYANQDCLDAVSKLQKHLISFMPLTLFEQLPEDRNSRNRNNNPLFFSQSQCPLHSTMHITCTIFLIINNFSPMCITMMNKTLMSWTLMLLMMSWSKIMENLVLL